MQTQSQQIDWLTMEIQPVIEANFGPATLEYSRTMRSFTQGDQGISRGDYGTILLDLLDGVGQHPYAQVADNFTQIDRVKLGVDLTENTQFYGNLFYGDTENEYRKTHRNFDGWDLRLTNQTFDSLNLTAYAKQYNEKGQTPPFHPEDGQFVSDPPRLQPERISLPTRRGRRGDLSRGSQHDQGRRQEPVGAVQFAARVRPDQRLRVQADRAPACDLPVEVVGRPAAVGHATDHLQQRVAVRHGDEVLAIDRHVRPLQDAIGPGSVVRVYLWTRG